MQSVSDTKWDLVIVGTGLPQSLLALALSRSDKKILHVDRNAYYGGENAALSLQDAEEWVSAVVQGSSRFKNARIVRPESSQSSLGFSRAYSLALSPQIIYSRSALLPTLVSSKVYRQLEFLAVGAWWVYEKGNTQDATESGTRGQLKKIPGGREDVFADKTIDLKAKRSLMKFLKATADPETYSQLLETHGSESLADFLTGQYNIPGQLQAALNALTLSPNSPSNTLTSYALPRITRHLSSIGLFGPGFGAVVPKWGGLSEVAQVGCRACAVGGGVYMLGQGVQAISREPDAETTVLTLQNGETATTHWTAGCGFDLPLAKAADGSQQGVNGTYVARMISIISSSLSSLFPTIADGAPPPASTVIVFPAESLERDGLLLDAPIYLTVHSSETGECPTDQCVLYSSVDSGGTEGISWLHKAVQTFVNTLAGQTKPEILWALEYMQPAPLTQSDSGDAADNVILFPEPSLDLAFDDAVLQAVRTAWQRVSGEADGFMEFEDRELGAYDDEED